MSGSVGQTLQEIRKKLGFTSARSFYLSLSKRSELLFNYSYYIKIESNHLIPSEKIIAQLASFLPEPDGDSLVTSYCSALFPDRSKRILKEQESKPPTLKTKPAPRYKKSNQIELTEKQVAVIATDTSHYFLFLLITLARVAIKKEQLKKYDFKNLDLIIKNLSVAKIICIENDEIIAAYPEFSFPRPETNSLKKLFEQLNEFDLRKNNFFQLIKQKRAAFFKRVSPRQAEIILMHLELLFQMIRTADEHDVSYNTEVLSLDLSYFQGKVLG